MLESKKIEAFEMRKTREYNRKFSKQVSALKTQAKSEDRKSQLKEVSRISRQNSSSGEKDAAFNKIFSGDGKSKKRQAMVSVIVIYFVAG